jgi:hypothetical protein
VDTINIIQIALAVIPVLIIGVFLGIVFERRQRTKKLREKFGPEYEHILNELGDRRQAEHELAARLEHVEALDIRPLSEEEIEDFTSRWQATQAEFVDDPSAAMQQADKMIGEVMRARGYPVEDFDQQVADISVDYPELVTDYRGLHLIAVRGRQEEVSTEEMRQAMIHGRALFNKLMDKDETVEIEHEMNDEKERHNDGT